MSESENTPGLSLAAQIEALAAARANTRAMTRVFDMESPPLDGDSIPTCVAAGVSDFDAARDDPLAGGHDVALPQWEAAREVN